MAVTKASVRKATEKAASRSGQFRYLKKGVTTSLRVLEYKDKEGNTVFAQPVAEHRKNGDDSGKNLGICREETFGEPCPFCKINSIVRSKGKQAPFRTRVRYAMNAVDINDTKPQMRIWIVPQTVFTALAEYALDDEWEDVFQPKEGYPFGVSRKGEGLDTEYTVKPGRKAWPTSKELTKQIVDPLTKISDPGIEDLCKEIGIDMADIYEEDEIAAFGAEDKPKKKTGKKSTKKDAEPEDEDASFDKGDRVYTEEYGEDSPGVIAKVTKKGLHVKFDDGDEGDYQPEDLTLIEAEVDEEPEPEVEAEEPDGAELLDDIKKGSMVTYLDEDGECEVTHIDGDDVQIKDAGGELYDVVIDDLKLVDTDEEPEPEDVVEEEGEEPQCFGNPAMLDPEDTECTECDSFVACSAKVGGGKKSKKTTKKSGKKTTKKSTKADDGDDVLGDILG